MRAAAATLRRLPYVAVRLPRVALALSPRQLRRRLAVAALVALALSALYLMWFRDSSLVRVERVTVAGLDTPDGPRVRSELTEAARRMTTLHLDAAALRHAVAGEPIVRGLRLSPDFPHGLRIEVVENRPVAMLSAGSREIAAAPDGTLLPGARVGGPLPVVRLRELPSGARLDEPSVRQLVAVAGAAPVPLLAHMVSVSRQSGHGIVVQLRRGPAVWFGAADALPAKWRAAAAVLARRSSQGATYIDVRMPVRPVAGGLPLPDPPQPDAQGGVIHADPGVAPGAAATSAQSQTPAQAATPAATTQAAAPPAAGASPPAANPQP